MLQAGFQGSRRDCAGFPALPVFLLLWTLLLLCPVASEAGQAAFGQQKSTAAPAAAGASNSAGIGTGSRTIEGLWQFHMGNFTAQFKRFKFQSPIELFQVSMGVTK